MSRGLSPSAWVGAVMLGVFVVLGVIGPWLAPYPVGVAAVDQAPQFLPPSSAHWLGTDENGVDALSQLLHGARAALQLSLVVVSVCAVIGVAIGVTAGYFRGVIDELIMRVIDILMAFPGILLNIAIVAAVADPGVGLVMAALIVNGWVGYARVARGQVLSLRERDYVAAARAIGATDTRIMARHVVPNLLAPIMVQMTFGFGGIILVEASLSFLGLGPQTDHTWGAMLDQGRNMLFKQGFEHYVFAPGLAIAWVVLGANLLGDGLRDRFDPRNRGRG
ncbi:MAG TPA: ABC transporter permease [Kofleriaceae bacterium]|jgi:peptide/nickel transport system permease protein|nr:ABC transporter permease [Kofleriaceae bacterium]